MAVSIQDVGQRIKTLLHNERFFLLALILIVAGASFSLGYASHEYGTSQNPQKPGITLVRGADATEAPRNEASAVTSNKGEVTVIATTTSQGAFVASKKGTKYHLPWCPGAKTISAENVIYFATKNDAARAGYTPAKNCKGIEQ